MPANITVTLVVLSLVWVGVLTYHELRQQKITLKRRREIRMQLGQFIQQCGDLKRKCAGEQNPPDEFAQNLATEMGSYLHSNLGDDYIARLNSRAGMMAISVTVKHQEIWRLCNGWEIRLNEFLAELKY